MRCRLALLASAASLVFSLPAAFAQAPGVPPSNPGLQCDLIGCESGVFFDAGRYFAAHVSVERIRVCALGRCRSLHRGESPLLRPVVLAVAGEQTITITATAFGPRGRIVLRRQLVAQLRKVQPKGPQCKPICFQATARLSRDGVVTGTRR